MHWTYHNLEYLKGLLGSIESLLFKVDGGSGISLNSSRLSITKRTVKLSGCLSLIYGRQLQHVVYKYDIYYC